MDEATFGTADMNKELLAVQESWARRLYSQLNAEYVKNEATKGKLSCAFSCGVSEHYINSDKKIMIVGQEAKGHTFDPDWNLQHWQEWAIDYLNRQVYKDRSRNISFNNSPFWRFFRKLKEKGYDVCWNNLDKVRRYVKVDEKDWVESKLPYDEQNSERAILNKKIFDAGSKSLLQKEIQIADPDIVIFVVGPQNPYYHTLYMSFLDDEKTYEEILNTRRIYPSEDNACRDVSDDLGLNKKAYYTFHPNYLSRKKIMDDVIYLITSK